MPGGREGGGREGGGREGVGSQSRPIIPQPHKGGMTSMKREIPISYHRAQRARLLLRGQGLESELGQEEMKDPIVADDDVAHEEGEDEEEEEEEDNNSNHDNDNDNDNAVQGDDNDENIDEEDDSVPLWLQKLSDSSPLLRL